MKIKLDFGKDFKIKEIKEELNLLMYNSKLFTFQDMKLFNQLVEVLNNVKISTY